MNVKVCAILFLLMGWLSISYASQQIPLMIEQNIPGAPITLGIPFPKGVLQSPDHVRLLGKNGKEIPSQITEVSTWEPADNSIKWIWVFFFSETSSNYVLEYGEDVVRAPITGDVVKMINRQRSRQSSEIDTGPLRLVIRKSEGGFLDRVQLDLQRNGFGEEDIIAESPEQRGSFLDILDDAGIDASKAKIIRSFKEKGSGPLHAILRLEGEYYYNQEDNVASPFTIRIHAYAGKSYIKVFHTLTYTGIPDKHEPYNGQHASVATSKENIIKKQKADDPGWTQANDQISSVGLGLKLHLDKGLKYKTSYENGEWWRSNKSELFEHSIVNQQNISVFQTGPKPNRIPPVPNSTTESRIQGFEGVIDIDDKAQKTFTKGSGWADISDNRWGVSVGICNFLEEYPKEIKIEIDKQELTAYLWSPKADPMSFARWSNKRDQGMIDNFATGVTKTSELVYYFHSAESSVEDIQQKMDYFLNAPVAHATPECYANSKVYGQFSTYQDDEFMDYERGLEYRLDWSIFNQHWEPWYGMFDYGDHMNLYIRNDWYRWMGNEPAVDYMLWLQFMRTGKAKYYQAAQAMSRHTMDVDNIHWPAEPKFYGDGNDALDFWEFEAREQKANPYLGIGRRHANQHWNAILSAHVWIQGWLASYYLTGYHRGLDIARLSADSHTRRIWGDHGLTGRRLYLSVWNMVEVWDATKDSKYFKDLEDRVNRMICLQNGPDQYNSLVIDRYGYSQVYASHGLYKYYQLTGEEKVRLALIKHARAVRDNPPWNHAYESYLSSIHSLLVGHELSGEPSFLNEAIKRSGVLKTNQLEASFEALGTQKNIAKALENASNLPGSQNSRRNFTIWDITQGLRVFGWTHIYNVPWLLHWLREGQMENKKGGTVEKK